jgi:hypothetical protein
MDRTVRASVMVFQQIEEVLPHRAPDTWVTSFLRPH